MTLFTFMLLLLAQGSGAAVNAGPVRQSAEDKIVCKLSTEAGTKIPQRICRTDAEWERISKEAQDDMHSSRNKSVSCGSSFAC